MAHYGRKCTICTHPRAAELEAALSAGEAIRSIAARFDISASNIRRHRDNRHAQLRAESEAAFDEAATDESDVSALSKARWAIAKCQTLYERAERARNARDQMAALRELKGFLELSAKITGEMSANGAVTINIAASQQFIEVRTIVLGALAEFPDALAAVRRAFGMELNGDEQPPGWMLPGPR